MYCTRQCRTVAMFLTVSYSGKASTAREEFTLLTTTFKGIVERDGISDHSALFRMKSKDFEVFYFVETGPTLAK
jgi:hypothetical protein